MPRSLALAGAKTMQNYWTALMPRVPLPLCRNGSTVGEERAAAKPCLSINMNPRGGAQKAAGVQCGCAGSLELYEYWEEKSKRERKCKIEGKWKAIFRVCIWETRREEKTERERDNFTQHLKEFAGQNAAHRRVLQTYSPKNRSPYEGGECARTNTRSDKCEKKWSICFGSCGKTDSWKHSLPKQFWLWWLGCCSINSVMSDTSSFHLGFSWQMDGVVCRSSSSFDRWRNWCKQHPAICPVSHSKEVYESDSLHCLKSIWWWWNTIVL